MTRDVDAIRADLAARTVGGMASSAADRDIAALLGVIDEQNVVPVVDSGRTDVIHRALLDYAAPVPDLGWRGCAHVTENAEEIAGFVDEFMGDVERGYPIRRPGEPVEQTR